MGWDCCIRHSQQVSEGWQNDEASSAKYHGVRRNEFHLSGRCMEYLVSLNGTYFSADPSECH
jgi:hypothetical protein